MNKTIKKALKKTKKFIKKNGGQMEWHNKDGHIHFEITNAEGETKKLSMGSSPSDWRAMYNWRKSTQRACTELFGSAPPLHLGLVHLKIDQPGKNDDPDDIEDWGNARQDIIRNGGAAHNIGDLVTVPRFVIDAMKGRFQKPLGKEMTFLQVHEELESTPYHSLCVDEGRMLSAIVIAMSGLSMHSNFLSKSVLRGINRKLPKGMSLDKKILWFISNGDKLPWNKKTHQVLKKLEHTLKSLSAFISHHKQVPITGPSYLDITTIQMLMSRWWNETRLCGTSEGWVQYPLGKATGYDLLYPCVCEVMDAPENEYSSFGKGMFEDENGFPTLIPNWEYWFPENEFEKLEKNPPQGMIIKQGIETFRYPSLRVERRMRSVVSWITGGDHFQGKRVWIYDDMLEPLSKHKSDDGEK